MPKSLAFVVLKRGLCFWATHYEVAIEHYCEKYNHDVFFCGIRGPRNAAWYKLKAFDYLSVDYLVIMDLDMFPMPWAPNLAEHLRRDSICMVRDAVLAKQEPHIIEHATNAGYKADEMIWNTGLIGIPRSMSWVLDSVWHNYDTEQEIWYEQSTFNELIAEASVPVHELDPKFNALAYLEKPTDLAKYVRDNWFIHAAGAPAMHKLQLAIEIWEAMAR